MPDSLEELTITDFDYMKGKSKLPWFRIYSSLAEDLSIDNRKLMDETCPSEEEFDLDSRERKAEMYKVISIKKGEASKPWVYQLYNL